jgi:hypothetical protein
MLKKYYISKKEVEQPIKVEQSANFLSSPIEGGFFDIKLDSPNIFVDVPTKTWTKFMMRHKGKKTCGGG